MAIFKKKKTAIKAAPPEEEESLEELETEDDEDDEDEDEDEETEEEEKPIKKKITKKVKLPSVEKTIPEYKEVPICLSQAQVNNIIIENNIMLKQILLEVDS